VRHAVVDTSVLISAFLFPESLPGRLIELAHRRRFVLHLSPIILAELGEALRRDRLRRAYGHDDAAIEAWGARLCAIARLPRGPLPEIGPLCRDPDDDHVIAAGLVTGARWIVTGDKDLLALGRHEAIRIVTTREFLHGLTGG
jgi:putative PIN family toxin of toxin-antitoxin system